MPNQIQQVELPKNEADEHLLLADPFAAFTEWASPEDDAAFQHLAEDVQPAINAPKEA